MTKPLKLKTVRDMPRWAISLGTTLYNKTGTWRNFRPIYENKTPPCNHACPANEKIQGCIDLINHRKYAEAWHLIKEDNPFTAVCGRVCFRPCETDCNRSFYDDTIAIHNIERFIGDYGLKRKLKVKSKKSKRKEKIAIIGGGPAGLTCAYFLARNGYRPTIFETSKKLGGLLAHGIPDYRLPKNILKQEINSILKLGVDVRTNIRVGQDKTLESIFG
ncbi:MAG: NAD(P)-binding protein, partial [Planctomycetes bacterium]|nr:NAD(P)-binding protein [Planctomycetota bacterium]